MQGISSGWDIHDTVYPKELLVSNRANGYRDILARIDLATYRRLTWEANVPFFLVSFLDPDTQEPIPVCPRGSLAKTVSKAETFGWEPVAGVEYEYFQFNGTYILSHKSDNSQMIYAYTETPNTLAEKKFMNLSPLTSGSKYFTFCGGPYFDSRTSAWIFSSTHTAKHGLFPRFVRRKQEVWD